MAITITQEPRAFGVTKQDLILVAESDNYTEDGFRYGVEVQVTNDYTSESTNIFITPNANNDCVINIQSLVREYHHYNTATEHSEPASAAMFMQDYGTLLTVFFSITEWWEIAGVLTQNEDSYVQTDNIYIVPGYFDPKFGFSPDTQGTDKRVSFTLNGNTKRMWSDRFAETHVWMWGDTFSLPAGQTRIFIPVREADYGVIHLSDSDSVFTNQTMTKLSIVLTDSTGTTHTYTEAIADDSIMGFAPVYPANLNDGTIVGLVKPEDYPNWKYYIFRATQDDGTPSSAAYIFYNTAIYGDYDCQHDVVRLGWENSRGGFDYFNFTKKNEESLNLERKRYRKVKGNYADAGVFTYGAYESGLTERTVTAEKYLNITSDWIQEGEFVLLQHLLASEMVHWIQDDGSYLPVVIEDSDYVVRRERNGKVKNLTLKLKLANTWKI